jgi:RNA polymerase sigma-70 factor (ECF subfamily)
MSHPISPTDLPAIQRIAAAEATRLCRNLGLPPQDRADIGNDLLADLLSRLPAYNPSKGTLGGFARVCMRHAACRIAQKHRQQRRVADARKQRAGRAAAPPPGGHGGRELRCRCCCHAHSQ